MLRVVCAMHLLGGGDGDLVMQPDGGERSALTLVKESGRCAREVAMRLDVIPKSAEVAELPRDEECLMGLL